jgi:hypothetical protein
MLRKHGVLGLHRLLGRFMGQIGLSYGLRDVERLCQYFARYGIQTDARRLSHQIWTRYLSSPTGEDVLGA